MKIKEFKKYILEMDDEAEVLIDVSICADKYDDEAESMEIDKISKIYDFENDRTELKLHAIHYMEEG